MLKQTLNKKISPIFAIGLTIFLASFVGIFTLWQFSKINNIDPIETIYSSNILD